MCNLKAVVDVQEKLRQPRPTHHGGRKIFEMKSEKEERAENFAKNARPCAGRPDNG